MWESVAQSYGGVIKFGRVNAVSQNDVLPLLPYHISYFPTIISINPGYYPEIFTWTYKNTQFGIKHKKLLRIIALKKFIESNIVSQINEYDVEQVANLVNNWEKPSEVPQARKPDILLITSKDSTPIIFKYGSYKLKEFFNFYQNKFGISKQVKKPF
jgi:hypothetical protein